MKIIQYVVIGLLTTGSTAVLARGGSDRSGGGSDRWNGNGPAWYQTQCGAAGFSVTHGLPYEQWRKPCSVPVRVCEFEKLTLSFPADPDVPCASMAKPEAAGELKRTYLKTWD